MARTDISKTTTSDLDGTITTYSVDSMTPEGAYQNETYYDNPNFNQYFGYYKKIPELKKAIDALALWTSGKGFKADSSRQQVILERINGWGEDTMESIFFNMIVMKKIEGDAFAEIIRDKKGNLLNLKVLNPGKVRIVANKKGLIKRYELKDQGGKVTTKFKPNEILHLCNDRVADEIHGTSVVEACEGVILARNEAISDWRKVLHRNVVPLRIIEVAVDDATKRNALKKQYEDAIDKGEVLIVPKGNVEIKDSSPVLQDPQGWIRYLENFFYHAVGIPKVVLGGSEEFTESSAKVGYLTFEQVYSKEQRELEADLWAQLGIKITFEKPASLKNEMLQGEQKNTGQLNIQPHEMQAGMGRE